MTGAAYMGEKVEEAKMTFEMLERDVSELAKLNRVLEEQNKKLRKLLGDRLGRYYEFRRKFVLGPLDLELYQDVDSAIDAALRQMEDV